MKRISFFTLFLFVVSLGFAATPDTLVDVHHSDRVILTKCDSTFTVDIYGKAGNPDYHYSYSRMSADDASIDQRALSWDFGLPLKNKGTDKYSCIFIGGIHFGFVTALGAPKEMNVDMGSSYEIGFSAIGYHQRWGKDVFRVALGFNWTNYRLTGHQHFYMKEDGTTAIGTYPAGANPDYSRIKVFSLNFPLEYVRKLNKDWNVGVAAILNFNTYASLETRYLLNGETHKDFNKNLHQNRFTIDFRGSVRWKCLGAYVKYSPFKVIREGFGPQFSGLSTGITLLY